MLVWFLCEIINTKPAVMKKLAIFLLTILLSLYGCKKENSKNDSLLNTKWTLSYIQHSKTNAITNYPSEEVSKISIVFTDSLNIISFDGICNTGWGIYSNSSNTGAIKITDLVTTINYCLNCEYCSEWEGYTTQNLDSAFSYKINGNNLEIYSNGTYNLYFSKD